MNTTFPTPPININNVPVILPDTWVSVAGPTVATRFSNGGLGIQSRASSPQPPSPSGRSHQILPGGGSLLSQPFHKRPAEGSEVTMRESGWDVLFYGSMVATSAITFLSQVQQGLKTGRDCKATAHLVLVRGSNQKQTHYETTNQTGTNRRITSLSMGEHPIP